MLSKDHPTADGVRGVVRLQLVLFWICASLLALVPVVFSTAVYRSFALPKLVVLMVGSAAIVLMVSLIAANDDSFEVLGALKSKQVVLVFMYLTATALSTILGVVPLASLFGSYENEMGLITRFCFFAFFVGLIVAVGSSHNRFLFAVRVMVLAGLIAAAYAFMQFFGRDPFLPAALYTFDSPNGPAVRVTGTLGHSNYLGNFLLYTTPVAAALAIALTRRARRFALATAALSVAAIVFSGTRGAWLGLLAGAVTFAFCEIRRSGQKPARARRYFSFGFVMVLAIVVLSVVVIILNPASRSIGVRARSFAADRFTGSGRILLWRDAARMVPSSVLVGCGPDGFSRAFLAYKSRELAIQAPKINNESAHNSYLDAAVLFGLPGAIAYIAIIGSAFRLLLRSRRRASDAQTRIVITGLISSFASVAVHNFFIYDQIPTGLYFFALMALAVIASNVTGASENASAGTKAVKKRSSAGLRWAGRAIAVASFALIAAAAWFSASLVDADAAIKQAFAAATSKDFEELSASSDRATRKANPTGSHDFLVARALTVYADAVPRGDEGNKSLNTNSPTHVGSRAWAIENATAHALKSLAYSTTPEANYVLLAYLAMLDGNTEKLHDFAIQAIQQDPNYFNARWLLAEALLAEGDRGGAEREAQLALRLRPYNSKVLSVLARARGSEEFGNSHVLGLVEHARLLRDKGNAAKAQELLVKAIQFSNGPCPGCHRELALVYEKMNQAENAIVEWQVYALEAPDRASADRVPARIEALRRK